MTIWEYFFLLKNLRSVLTAYTVNRCFGFKWTIWKSTLLNCAKITIPLQYGQFDNFFLPKTEVQKSLRDLFFFFFFFFLSEGKSLWLFLCSYFDICIVRESLSGFRWCSGIEKKIPLGDFKLQDWKKFSLSPMLSVTHICCVFLCHVLKWKIICIFMILKPFVLACLQMFLSRFILNCVWS